MTPAQKLAFESIVGLVHREAKKIAELPNGERASALQIARQSIEAELGTTESELIEICFDGVATVLQQIDEARHG